MSRVSGWIPPAMSRVCNYKMILGSASPRRRELLRGAGFEFTVLTADIDESAIPEGLEIEKMPEYISQMKAKALLDRVDRDTILITADTIVRVEGRVLGKPADREDAIEMLKLLSGRKHTVITGVSIIFNEKKVSFSVATDVFFRNLEGEEIEYYVDNYKPFDKAGSYGIQEWIGYVGIERIEGSFYNVMGLPIQALFAKLKELGVLGK